jgi:CTP synthase
MKTKPTQTAIKLLRENGIQPDFILCRGKRALDEVRKKKIEKYSNVKSEHVISMPDVIGKGTVNTIYVIPLNLEKENIGDKLLETLELKKKKQANWERWKNKIDKLINPLKKIKIGMIGKYLDIGDFRLTDSYISINEALKHAGAEYGTGIEIKWIDAKEFESNLRNIKKIKNYDGIIIPGGFGSSGIEGKISAIRYARENNIPFLGLCLGMQLAVVEFARNVCKLQGADSSEVNPKTKHAIIDILPEQKNITNKGGTMRLGAYKALLKKDTQVRKLYGKDIVYERHRHRYELNPKYHEILQKSGMIFSGVSPDKRLVEFIELPKNKFFIATQAHPEFKSSLLNPSPIFKGFVKACIN